MLSDRSVFPECSRRCCTGYAPVSDRHKFPLPSCWPEPHRLYTVRVAINATSRPISFKCLISNHPGTIHVHHSFKTSDLNSTKTTFFSSICRPKSVPSSPSVMRAFSRLGNLTAGWGRSSKKQDRLTVDDKKWTSSQDCSKRIVSFCPA